MKKLLFLSALILIVACVPQASVASQSVTDGSPWEKFTLNVGGFLTNYDSGVRLGGTRARIEIDGEDTLGLETSQTVFRIDGLWRFTNNRRHRLDFSWWSLKRDGTRTLLEDIEFNDTTFPIGTVVNSSLNTSIYKGTYSYSLIQNNSLDLGVSIGLYVAQTDFAISSSGLFTGSEAESITAPLPVLGIRADIALAPKIFLKNSLDVFYYKEGGFKGSFYDLKVVLEWNAFKNIGFGIGAESLRLDLEADGAGFLNIDLRGSINLENLGLLFYGKLYF